MIRSKLLASAVSLALALEPLAAGAAAPVVVPQPGSPEALAPYLVAPGKEPRLSQAEMIAALRKHVKYVFVLFQENRSFDSYFGTFPGANGLYGHAAPIAGFTQPIENTDGTMGSISPFRIGPADYAADTDDVDHSHPLMAKKMDVVDGKPMMDRFALVEEQKHMKAGGNPSLEAKQFGELDMAYEDCDTVPFLWNYANRFVLFDGFHQHTIGPSTPAAIDMIAGQTGETQWVKHPDQSTANPKLAATGAGEPVTSDNDPLWGSPADPTKSGMPENPADEAKAKYALNQTYASLPLTFTGKQAGAVTKADKAPKLDLADVTKDIPAIMAHNGPALHWGWYEEGYDHEPTDPAGAPAGGTHESYIGHHNAPQYFGYVANNPKMADHLHGLGDFFADIGAKKLSATGGVYYVRGGYKNIDGLKPADPDAAVQKHFQGDDDHPGYSDSALSEEIVARAVNAIAASPYWAQSAIVITYDESEGNYDHVPPAINETDPSGVALSQGPRIPLILISPYGRTHAISHEAGDHASIIRMIDILFRLPMLADLPEEAAARAKGKATLKQDYLGPADDKTPGIGDLLSAFDPARLTGKAAPLPASYAEIPDADVRAIPPYANQGCKAIGIVPTDIALGIKAPPPADFNPRPHTDPTQPKAP